MGAKTTDTPSENPVDFWKNALEKRGVTTQAGTIEDIAKTSPKLISEIIEQATTPEIEKMHTCFWEEEIAPAEIISDDYDRLLVNDKITLVSSETASSFMKRAIPGHAQSGHGEFEIRYPNTELRNVIPATGESLESFQNKSQQMTDNIVHSIEGWFNRATGNASSTNKISRIAMLQNDKGTPINGLEFLAGTPVDILELTRGFYFGSLMDNFSEIRQAGFEKYGHQTGGGEAYLASIPQLKKFGINLDNMSEIKYRGIFEVLGHMSSEGRINVLENLKIIENGQLSLDEILKGDFSWDAIKHSADTTDLTKTQDHMACYIRDLKGRGVGDDIAVFLSTFLPQTYTKANYKESAQAHQSRFLGTLLADHIDTVEKGSRMFIPGGQDEVAGQYLNRLFRKSCQDDEFRQRFGIAQRKDGDYNLVDEDTIIDFTMASANTKKNNVHSSQRWFYKKVGSTCAITEYMKYAYFHVKSQNKRINSCDLSSFNIEKSETTSNARFTYQGIPLRKIENIFKERLELVINSDEREERIARYFE